METAAGRPASLMDRDLEVVDPETARWIAAEARRQNEGLELIASENWVSRAVREAQGSVLTNKYAEGYPGKRYYGGCEVVDKVEQLAIDRAKALFSAEHANVQPHSGSQANMSVYLTALQPGDTILGMDLSHGGHLTHGHPLSFSGREYKVVAYGVRREDERIDYEALAALAREHRPKLIIAGASAYARVIDFEQFGKIADEVGAVLMCDIAHIAGLVIAGLHPSPVPHAPFVTTTTHKTLRGPGPRPLPHRSREGPGPQRLPGDPGRPSPARHRGQGRRLRRGGNAGVRDLPEAHRREREGARGGSIGPRLPPGLGRDGQSHDADRRRREGDPGQGRREDPREGRLDRQQEHDPVRHALPDGRHGDPHRHARRHDSRHANGRDADHRRGGGPR